MDAVSSEANLTALAVALGIGLVVGGERERRKREKPAPSIAGIRTFALASMAGAVSFILGGWVLLAVATASVALLAAVAGWLVREDDAGTTTEVALVLTVLLGGLAFPEPALAASAGVVLAILLAARTPLHRFVTSVLSADEVRDGLILAGAALVVLPVLPDRTMGPFGALNPHALGLVGVLVLTIGAGGHVAVRLLGARYGLPIAGLASGFISSSATIGAMGARAARAPGVLSAAAAAAVLSTVSTILQMAAIIAAVSVATLRCLAVPLAFAGMTAVAYGVAFTVWALRQPVETRPQPDTGFKLTTAAIFALTLALVLVASAALRQWFGQAGTIAAAALAGLVDPHASAVSIASLVASGRLPADQAAVPILASLSTNTLTKLVLAWTTGGSRFAWRVAPGLVLVALAAWIGAAVGPGLR